jgi:signal peptidase I
MREQHSPRFRRARRWLDNALLLLMLGLAALGAAAVISGSYQVRPVLSGSMTPGLPIGGVVVTERVPVSELQVRDVIVFHRPDKPEELIVHRIIALTPGASGPVVQTQGDANYLPDPWKVSLRGSTAYRAVFSVPLVGYAAVWAHGPAGRETLMVVGALLIVGAAAGSLIRLRWSTSGARRDADGLTPDDSAPSSADVDPDARVEAAVTSSSGV